MKLKSVSKWLSLLIIACMLFTSLGTVSGAEVAAKSDTKGHWAENQINSWIGKGWIKGYEDGSFKPEQTITRAEFVTLVNRSFGFTEETSISFSDVVKGIYYYEDVAKAMKVGYIQGYADGTFGANKPISRQEAAVIIDRLLGLSKTARSETDFSDKNSIAPWAKDAVNAVVAHDIFTGYAADHTLRPLNAIKRGEAVTVLDRALAKRVTTYNTAGIHGPTTGIQTVDGNVVIQGPGVTLQNMVINGNLVFAAGIGSGDATLNHVTVKGQTTVEGGGENSIHFIDSILLTIRVDKQLGTVRIVAEGTTTVGEVTIESPTTIQEKGTTGTGFSKVTLSENLPADSKVTLLGSFESLAVKGDKIQIDIPEGSVKELIAELSATGMSLRLGAEATIIHLVLDAVAKILGTGTIETATLSKAAKDATTFEKQPKKKEDKVEGVPTPTPTIAPSSSSNSGVNPPPSTRLSIVSYGAIANDGLDDLPAIKLAVEAAKAQGKSVYVPSGEFNLNGLLTLDSVDLSGDGETSILKSMDLKLQAVILMGDGTDLSAVKLTSVPATVRLTNDDSARVRVGSNATNYSIKHIVIDGGSSVGFLNAGTHGVISGNTVKNMLADGIHITALSNDILVENNTVHQVGDDFIAVVSYEKFGGWVKNVVIRNNHVSQGEARGLTVSGGENVLIENNTVSDVYGAGIYLSSEGNYKTYTVKDVIVRNNTVTNDSMNGGSPTKGGLNITATNKNPSIDNVLVENNTFIDSQDNGALIVGTFEIDGLQIRNNVFQNPANYGIMIVRTVFGAINITGNTVTSSGKAVYVNNSTDPDITSDLTNEADNGGGGGTNVAAYGTPAIDGQADDFWAYSTVLQMDATAAGTTGTARVAWDENKLYYLFEMKDTTPFAVSEKEKNDSVEVWVDELNTKNGTQTTGDYQMRVDLNNAKTTSMSNPVANFLNSVTSAVYRTQAGYQVEIAVPYTTTEHAPKVGDIVGFNASANDDANGDGLRDGFMTWVDRNLPYWADTRVYNEVKLAAAVPLAAYGKPVLDGTIDSFWANSTPLQMDTIATGTTGKVRVAWDETALYYLFEMKDTTPFAVAEKEKNDSVEVWVDELNTKNGAQTIGDYQIRVDLNNAKTTSMKVTDILNNVTSAVYKGNGSYIVEIAVKYTKLIPSAGEIIGFNATANDDSNGDGLRNGFVTWVDRNLPYWADTRVYNRIQLAKAKEVQTLTP
ncbi:hypothetical protein GQF01_03220 [Paenibacillus sp. 5J-6]|uniref:SLH domain-containing protein n=1 Tax=Paenibacillus silvestris TaxID=2606219 RepID=A0A6L8USR3_9BACL|nr:sugar-binding protein [Paenibacillus silvestris]MZQ81145.1 hypothetical protein [Paenibacillus silvestris]